MEELCLSATECTYGVRDVWQTEIHTVKTSQTESSCLEGEIAIEKLKRYKSPATDQVLAN
jgi:hypothetical protein